MSQYSLNQLLQDVGFDSIWRFTFSYFKNKIKIFRIENFIFTISFITRYEDKENRFHPSVLKYLKTKAHLINNNIAEELETPKQPKRIVRYLTLEKSVRLLIESNSSSVRDNCIITIFLNCALRLSELASINLDQVNSDVLSVIGKGNKERKIFITPAVKQTITKWLSIRNSIAVDNNALFISRNGGRLTTRAIQNVVKKHIVAAGINPEGLTQAYRSYSNVQIRACRHSFFAATSRT